LYLKLLSKTERNIRGIKLWKANALLVILGGLSICLVKALKDTRHVCVVRVLEPTLGRIKGKEVKRCHIRAGVISVGRKRELFVLIQVEAQAYSFVVDAGQKRWHGENKEIRL